MDPTLVAALLDAHRRGEPVSLATITHTWGHAPREVGAKMLVFRDGRALGSIGGGCGEAEVWRAALDAMDSGRPTTCIVSLMDDYLQDEGAICGGKMEVFVEPLSPETDPAGGVAP